MGAARSSVVGLVLRGGMTWAVGGIAVGLFGAWAVSRAIASLLFEISAADPLTFAVTALALAGVAGLACTVPAIRATHIEPDHCVARRLDLGLPARHAAAATCVIASRRSPGACGA